MFPSVLRVVLRQELSRMLPAAGIPLCAQYVLITLFPSSDRFSFVAIVFNSTVFDKECQALQNKSLSVSIFACVYCL